MRIAVISDIHANCFALEAVLQDINHEDVDLIIVLGDIVGYYPWATETFQLLKGLPTTTLFIKGNHDQLLLEQYPPDGLPSYWAAAEQNKTDLLHTCLEALDWLQRLDTSLITRINNFNFKLFHGTPDDPLEGRYYPDNKKEYAWFPKEREIILLGHTHYPLLKVIGDNAVILNPGSIGQPRDGNLLPSWALIDLDHFRFTFKRVEYDYKKAIQILIDRNWNNRAISALKKDYKGALLF